jgi:thymidylate synthase (FAD)
MTSEIKTLERPRVAALEEVLGVPFKVLNDGFVRAVDYLGGDDAIVQAARVSYGRGTKQLHEDRSLIRFLMRHQHTTPFEMCELKLHIRVPMDSWRQWIRHRTANVNEYSTRYSIAIDAAQVTGPDQWRQQAKGNRQGSAGSIPTSTGMMLSDREREVQQVSRQVYEERLTAGVAREQARKDLPLSTYTEAYWKIDLHNLLHFLRLRMDSGAQREIRDYATTIGHDIVARWCPVAWEAFLDYQLNATHLSNIEATVISLVARGKLRDAVQALEGRGIVEWRDGALVRNRERDELEEKLLAMALPIPWQQSES